MRNRILVAVRSHRTSYTDYTFNVLYPFASQHQDELNVIPNLDARIQGMLVQPKPVRSRNSLTRRVDSTKMDSVVIRFGSKVFLPDQRKELYGRTNHGLQNIVLGKNMRQGVLS